jgi:hypothetical protein
MLVYVWAVIAPALFFFLDWRRAGRRCGYVSKYIPRNQGGHEVCVENISYRGKA